jgi:hypothetical protein
MKQLAVVMAACVLAACSSEPTIQTGPDAETTFDGLVRIDNSRFANAWIDPDVNLKQYTKIIPSRAEFEFRAVKEGPRSTSQRRSLNNSSEFWISPANRERLVTEVSDVFRDELSNLNSFTITDEPGPDTLIVVGTLHDIVSNVPPDMIGRGEIFISSVGEATLVLELRDSLSGETIYRAVDRRRAEQQGGTVMSRSNSVTTWVEVRRLARRWAVRLREGLDSVHD